MILHILQGKWVFNVCSKLQKYAAGAVIYHRCTLVAFTNWPCIGRLRIFHGTWYRLPHNTWISVDFFLFNMLDFRPVYCGLYRLPFICVQLADDWWLMSHLISDDSFSVDSKFGLDYFGWILPHDQLAPNVSGHICKSMDLCSCSKFSCLPSLRHASGATVSVPAATCFDHFFTFSMYLILVSAFCASRSLDGLSIKLFQLVWPTTKPMARCLSCSRLCSMSAHRTCVCAKFWLFCGFFFVRDHNFTYGFFSLEILWWFCGFQMSFEYIRASCHPKRLAAAPSHPFVGNPRWLCAWSIYSCHPAELKSYTDKGSSLVSK